MSWTAYTIRALRVVGLSCLPVSLVVMSPPVSSQNIGGGPSVCGQQDDGSTETALGITGGGEIGWLLDLNCFQTVTSVHAAYGTKMFPGSVTNGAASQIAVYVDGSPDGDPRTDLSRVAHVLTVVTNGDTDILNAIPLPAPVDVGCLAWILASAEHIDGEFPAGFDLHNPLANAWIVGDQTTSPNGGHLDTQDLNNNSVPAFRPCAPPLHLCGSFLLRAEGFTCKGGDDPFLALCDCVDSGPCGNHGGPGRGCGNDSDATGALLGAAGTPTPGGLTLHGSGLVPNQPGLYFQGNLALNGGSGFPFGDGLRCTGSGVVRIEVAIANGAGASQTTVDVFAKGGVSPGDIKYYQLWYRDPGSSPCGTLFNLTNALRVRW